MPAITIRARYGRKMLRHGLRLGWRLTSGKDYPVTTTIAPECECECYLCQEEASDGSA